MTPLPPQWAAAQHRATVAAAALEVMSEAFNVPLARLATATRQQANVAFARQMAMYLCHVIGELSVREVAIEFAREPSTVSHACHAIEDRRDIDVFDRQLTVLEQALKERLEERIPKRDGDFPAVRRNSKIGLSKKSAYAPLKRLAG